MTKTDQEKIRDALRAAQSYYNSSSPAWEKAEDLPPFMHKISEALPLAEAMCAGVDEDKLWKDIVIGIEPYCQLPHSEDMAKAAAEIAINIMRPYLRPSSSQWQPIESAPKDGTVMIGCYQWSNECAFVFKFDEHGWCVGLDDFEAINRPTHWMPLPPPPSDSQPKEE